MDFLAGAFVQPSGRGFDFDVCALGVGFGVEVLYQDGKAVFPVLQDVFEATASSGLDSEVYPVELDGGVVAFIVGLHDLGQGFGF